MKTRSSKKKRDKIGLASVKKLSALLYRMGHTFDGLNADRISTEDFLRTGNPEVLSSKSNKELLDDLTAASTFVMETDYNVTPIDLDFVTNVNARLRRTASLTRRHKDYRASLCEHDSRQMEGSRLSKYR